MRRAGAGRWVAAGLGAGLAAAAVAGGPGAATAPLLVAGAAGLTAGELLWSRAVGRLLAGSGLLLLAAAAADPVLPTAVTARLAVLGGLLLLPLAVLAYPRLPPPPVAGPVVGGAVVVLAGAALVRPADPDLVGTLGLMIGALLVAALWWRYDVSDEADRRALLWPAVAVGLLAALLVPVLVRLDSLAIGALAGTVVPVSFVVGLRRPGLADVRWLAVRGVVAGMTVALYVALFSGLATVLRDPPTGVLALVGAVLAVGFRPAFTVLSGAVDEMLFGDRADPGRAVAGVGERLADDPVLALRALRQSLVLPYAALLAGGETVAASGTARTPTRSRPLRAGPDVIGELVVGLRPGELRLRTGDEAVLDVLAPALGQALHARMLATELRRSRGEVISVVEEERRRLRRDLHDGLGPTLTGVAYAADAARNLLAADPGAADALLAHLRTDTANAIAEVRRLVEGLRPPMLDELGLTGAIRQRARHLRAADGRALRVVVDAPDPLPPVPAAVEVVAFRIVVEALTNTCRHAGSDRAEVTVRVADDRLDLEVRDDGPADAVWTPGIGLTSMRERAESVGGTCTAGGGRVTTTLPLQ